MPYLKIETTIEGGITQLMETQETQIVAANNRTLKFYDFIDKNLKEQEESEKKRVEDLNKNMKEIFKEIDTETQWKLDREHLQNYFKLLHTKMGE